MVFYIVNDLNFVQRFCIDQVHKMCWIIVYDFITSLTIKPQLGWSYFLGEFSKMQ